MRQWSFSILLAMGLLIQVTSLQAADAPTSVIPADTGIVIKIASPAATIKKVTASANTLKEGWGSFIEGQTPNLGMAISNPTLAGVDQDKDWFVALVLDSEEEPSIIFIIPAKDINAMEEAISDDFEFIKHGDYGIYTEDEDYAAQIKKIISGEEKPMEFVAGTGEKLFKTADLGVYVNFPVILDTYEENINQAIEGIGQAIEQGLKQTEGNGLNADAIQEGIDHAFEILEQVMDDASSYTIAISLPTDGIVIEDFLSVSKDTKSSTYLSENKPDAPTLLTKLPAEQPLYFSMTGAGDNPLGEFMKWAIQMNSKVLDLEETQVEKMKVVEGELQDMKFKENSIALGLGDLNSGVLRLVAATKITPVDKWKTVLSEVTNAIGKLEMGEFTQEITFTPNAETVKDIKVDIMKTSQKFNDENVAQLQENIMRIVYGPEGNVARFMQIDGNIVQVMGGGAPAVEPVIDGFKANAGFASDSASARDRKNVQDKINILFMADFVGMVRDGMVIAAESGSLPLPVDSDTLTGLNLPRTYLTFGVSHEPMGVNCKTHIPLQLIKNGITLGEKLNKTGEKPDF
jgi:hypothetical protein